MVQIYSANIFANKLINWNNSPFCYQLDSLLLFHNVFPAQFRSSSSHNAKYIDVFNGVNLSLIQTTPCCAPPPHRDPFWVSQNIHQPWLLDLSASPASPLCPIRIKPDSVTLSVTFVHVHKSLLSLQERLRPQSPSSSSLRPPITTLHIQVINEVAPVCGIRSKVDLTVLVGFEGRLKSLGRSLPFWLSCSLVLLHHHSSVLLCSSRGRQRLTWLLTPVQTVKMLIKV